MSTETQIETEASQSTFLTKLSEFHNKSLLYQHQQNFEETIAYINKSLFLVKHEKKTHKYVPSLIVLKKYKVLRTLQLSAALSFTKNHQQALSSGKKALKTIFSVFEAISGLLLKLPKNLLKAEKTSKLKKIVEKILGHDFGPPFIILTQTWVSYYNMGNIMSIQEFQVLDWNQNSSLKGVLSLSFITQCIFLLVASYFTIATETRFADSGKDSSKDWYVKTLELGFCFLPGSSVFLQHIQKSYEKHKKAGKKEEFRKGRNPSVKRISLKRISERPRNSSEKYKVKLVESPSRRLTPSNKNMQSRIKISRLKKSTRETSPLDISKNPAIRKNSSILKNHLMGKTSPKLTELSSDSFDSNP